MRAPVSFFLFFCLIMFLGGRAQDVEVHPSKGIKGFFKGHVNVKRDIPLVTARDVSQYKENFGEEPDEDKTGDVKSYSAPVSLKGRDNFFQGVNGALTNNDSVLVNFDGTTGGARPPIDCNGAVGPNHFIQTLNGSFTIFSRTGGATEGPYNLIYMFYGLPGGNASYRWIDPITLYDEQADRWLMACFSFYDSTSWMLITVSATGDPDGDWNSYSFPVDYFPDYPKFGVWNDGYSMADNRYWLQLKGPHDTASNDTYVFQRDKMLNGDPALAVAFHNGFKPRNNDTTLAFVPPVHNVGEFAPAGSPGIFIGLNNDTANGGTNQVWIYELHVDWTNIQNSTLAKVQQLDVQPFSSDFGHRYMNIIQPDLMNRLDAIPHVPMNVPQYRNFGSYQSIVFCHTVNLSQPGDLPHAGIRWYELRKPPGGQWAVRQQNTYAPDDDNRWLGSVMLNGKNQIGLAYSITGEHTNPSIRFCGQNIWSYLGGNSTMDIAEDTIISGKYSQTYMPRWGDYALMSVDPRDDSTFWFTSQYIGSANNHKTRIASFNFNIKPMVVTKPATDVTPSSATLNGTVNPNGLVTTWHFEYGSSTSYGNSTPLIQAGSGIASLDVTAALSGLTAGATYHFRLAGTNGKGASRGADMTFTPGAASLTTTQVNNIYLTTASSGGIIISDGSYLVTARGICWSTEMNPTILDVYTTDGSGTGLFNSILGGLNTNTLYHVRAYATNAAGTWYGNDVSFTTLCKIYTFPFREGFDAASTPMCWTNVDNMGNGKSWRFGTIDDENPNPNLTGNYVYLNSDDYGSSSEDAELVSPQLDCSMYNHVLLEFDHYYLTRYYPTRSLSYSIDGGNNWIQFELFDYELKTNPARYSRAVPEVAGKSAVRFKWSFNATYDIYWAVDNVQIRSTDGIEQPVAGRVSIFPNPNKGIFNIIPVEGRTAEFNISVSDMNGRVILVQTLKGSEKYQLDLSAAPGGAYTLLIQTNTWLITRKIVILR